VTAWAACGYGLEPAAVTRRMGAVFRPKWKTVLLQRLKKRDDVDAASFTHAFASELG